MNHLTFKPHLTKVFRLALTLSILFCLTGCEAQVSQTPSDKYDLPNPEKFKDYWYAGKAELSHYDLKQMRYGEPREGDAVLIYVTEDFLKKEQVKREHGDKEALSVLKLNFIKKFITGIYDYSIMTSIFTPVQFRKHPATLKITFSSQDWCGQSFSQMNMRERELHYQTRSYFQNPGDKDTTMAATYIEEDVWTRIRFEPQSLPLGKIDMVPSQEFMRLHHVDLKPYTAIASLVLQVSDTSMAGASEFYQYKLEYPELDRVLKIKCQNNFPFKILSWEEITNASKSEKKEITRATLTNTLVEPYWKLNGNDDSHLRDSLGLNYRME